MSTSPGSGEPGPTAPLEHSQTEGRVLAGRYEILDFLGAGGMAQVFRGRDRVLDRTVAIKLLAANVATAPGSIERFRREARAAAGLSHPGIVAVYDSGSDGDLHYIVMELVEGRTLDRVLRDGPLAPDRALEIAERTCEALGAAHASGVIHRDVKPGNIMIGADGSVKVMDFGIARAVEADTGSQTASILGTASYLSPEQAEGASIDPRSDLYSLGVVLYEMLLGSPPFVGNTPVAIVAKHVHEAPIAPSQVDPGLSPDLDAVVMRALAKSPDDRQGSANELADDLRRLRAGAPEYPSARGDDHATRVLQVDRTEPITAIPPTGTAGRRARRRGRSPIAAVLAALAVLAIVLALLLVGLVTQDGEPGGTATGSPTPSSPAQTEPTTTSQPPEPGALSVSEAAGALAAEVAEGVQAGDITNKAGNEILRAEGKALRDFQRGDADKTLEGLAGLNARVDELFADGEITSEDRVASLHDAIADLEAAVQGS